MGNPGVAASQRVGNLIGAKDAGGARKAAHAAALLSAIMGSIVMAVMMLAKDVSFSLSVTSKLSPQRVEDIWLHFQ
jgi:Na+-driven multidrug efflux pump